MSIDMSQFYQVFFEETAEHLATMENLLLTLDVGDPDAEQLNAIFRAAHSIKGSSGTFGFTDLADVTHILENLLDRIRKGELRLREDMIDAFLDAGDVLKGQLAAHQGEGEADKAAAEAICQRLRQLTEDGAAAAPPPAAVPPAPTIAAEAVPQAAGAGLDLFFVLEGDESAAAGTIDNLMAELAEHGEARIAARPAAAGQPWHLQLIGEADAELMRGLLEFVARIDSIRVGPIGQAAEAALGDSPDGAYGFFGELPAEGAAPAAEEAYGFFEPLPETPAMEPADSGDEAYGFFEPLPQEAAPVPAAAAAPQQDESYGFFETALPSLGRMLLYAFIGFVAGLAVVALIDVPFQLWRYYVGLRMTKEELRQEMKELEGDPQLKARIRSQQREMARKRMMSEVPKADVVVTNPTHFAVALRYDKDKMGAPQVVAKGMNLVAQKIRDIAGENKVPILELPPLARALHRHVEIGEAVPTALYTAVAEVMAYIYQLNQFMAQTAPGMLPPEVPAAVAVPEGLDPGAID